MRTALSGIAVVAVIAAAPLAAGCGTSAPAAQPAISAPATSAPATSASATHPYCRGGQLRVGLGPLVSEATQQNTVILDFRNASAVTCDLRGYPGIALSDRVGAVLPFGYHDGGDQMLTSRAPTLVVLAPGAVAYAGVNKNTCVMYASRSAVGGEVTPPGGSQPLAFELPHYRILGYCRAGDPGHVVDVTPVEPTMRDVLAAF